MLSNNELFKLIMTEQFGFGINTDFKALKNYITTLINGAYDLNSTAKELGVTKKTLINWNKKLPVKYEIEKVKKSLRSEVISKWTVDEIADWNDNFRYIRKKFIDEVLKSDIEARVTFCIDSDGKNNRIVCNGRDTKVKAKAGTLITLTEYDHGCINNVKTEYVDGVNIKENTWYGIKNGEFIETPPYPFRG